MLAGGLSYADVATALGLSTWTVKRHVENAGNKIPGDMALKLRVVRWFNGKSTWLDK